MESLLEQENQRQKMERLVKESIFIKDNILIVLVSIS